MEDKREQEIKEIEKLNKRVVMTKEEFDKKYIKLSNCYHKTHTDDCDADCFECVLRQLGYRKQSEVAKEIFTEFMEFYKLCQSAKEDITGVDIKNLARQYGVEL